MLCNHKTSPQPMMVRRKMRIILSSHTFWAHSYFHPTFFYRQGLGLVNRVYGNWVESYQAKVFCLFLFLLIHLILFLSIGLEFISDLFFFFFSFSNWLPYSCYILSLRFEVHYPKLDTMHQLDLPSAKQEGRFLLHCL